MCCARATSFSFIFDRLYPMTDVSSGDGKGVIFLSFASSFMWCEQFCPGRTFYFDDFYFVDKPLAKVQKPPLEPPQYCQYLLALYPDVIYIS